MSLRRRFFNIWLRMTEKRSLARATSPEAMRKSFELKAKLSFHPPSGTRFSDDTIAGRKAVRVNADTDGPLIFYLHGGAYLMGSARTYRAMAAHLSREALCPVVLPEYRLAPEDPFPAALEDALDAYRAVMAHPRGVVLGGDSAGGGLALALLGEILRQGLPAPLGAFALSPLTDMTFSGHSISDNAQRDVVLPADRTHETCALYLDGADPADPRASPLFAKFDGGPPVWLAASDTEILLDDTTRMARHLRKQGVDVTEVIEADLPHVWTLLHNYLPEARRTLAALAVWIRRLSP